MTTWRYGMTVFRSKHGDIYEVREIYTGTGGKLSWTADPVSPTGETWGEVVEALIQMQTDVLTMRVLDITDPDKPQWMRAHTMRGPLVKEDRPGLE